MDSFFGVFGDFGVFGELVFHDAGDVGNGEVAVLRVYFVGGEMNREGELQINLRRNIQPTQNSS